MKPFRATAGGRDLYITPENTRIFLFRKEPYDDMDYFQVDDLRTEQTLSVYRNPDICRYMAGILFRANSIIIPKTERESFYDTYGFNPWTLIREQPDPIEIDHWIELEVANDLHEDGTFDLPEES